MTQGELPKNKGEYTNQQNKDQEGGNKEGHLFLLFVITILIIDKYQFQ